MATVFASGPQTRHHIGHAIYTPHCIPEPEKSSHERKRPYVSRQAPRSLRLQNRLPVQGDSQNDHQIPKSPPTSALKSPPLQPVNSVHTPLVTQPKVPAVEVKCMGRSRIPTFHGTVFLHIYHNNRDNKEHLAIVADSAQFSNDNQLPVPPIRSHSLDAMWRENESESERVTRGAYIGRLTPESQLPSQPTDRPIPPSDIPAPLVRIHSECFTGETIGSMRCDCGEQLDEAMRLISQPVQFGSSTIPGRGVVVYLRQEGRGIGLLSKLLAYNLQDLGHDTVSANLKLGHKADEREYEVAVAILKDLGLGSEQGEGVRLLTNNPDKVAALEKEGLRVVERVSMVPRSWKCQSGSGSPLSGEEGGRRLPGATMVGGEAVSGEDLDRYLRTKVVRMGHLLPLPLDL
ncbi:GTP cyclohydrolase II-domain-containing protein [Scleroderma citrinum]